MVEFVPVVDEPTLERWLEVRNAVDPRPLTLAAFRAEQTVTIGSLILLAVHDGRDVGASFVGWTRSTQELSIAGIDVWVIPEARHQGIGRSLVERSIAFAREHGLGRLWAAVQRGDDDSLRFGRAFGLDVDGGGQLGRLDLTDASRASSAETPPDGIVVTSAAERPDLERAVYDLEMLVRPEIPAMADEALSSFEAWQADSSGDPGFLPGLSLIALDGDRVVGALKIYDNAEGVVFIGMTAVHPDVRRRGIARLLKLELAARARTAGMTTIETYNDGANDRIRALNERLGYVYMPFFDFLKGPLPGDAPA